MTTKTTQTEVSPEVSPAVEVKKRINKEPSHNEIVILSTGIRAKIHPVSATLIDEVVSMVKDPPIPMWHNEEKDRDEPNSGDPEYIKALSTAERKRGLAAMDAMIMFGLELVDGLPDDEVWIKKLKYMEGRKMLDLSSYDFEADEDREFLYKRFVAVGTDDINRITGRSVIGVTEVDNSERSFRS